MRTQARAAGSAASAALLASALAVPLVARPARAPHAAVDLVADLTGVPPGGDVTLGLRFTLDPGWHIYWRNPGASGGPPVVAWKTPPELTVADLQWPEPQRFTAAGETTYGYERTVLLLAPARYKGKQAGTSLAIEAKVDYQVCKDVCLKETAAPVLALATGAGQPSPAAAEFKDTRERLPVPMPATWRVSATAAHGQIVLTIDTGQRETAATFLPYRPGAIDDNAPQRVEPRDTGATITVRSPAALPAPLVLEGLLVRPGARAVEIHTSAMRQ